MRLWMAMLLCLVVAPSGTWAFEIDLDAATLRDRFKEYQLGDLRVGDRAIIRNESRVCFTEDNRLALWGATWLGDESDYGWNLSITVKPGKRLSAELSKGSKASREPTFVLDLWPCTTMAQWLNNPGDLFVLDTINGHTKLSDLLADL